MNRGRKSSSEATMEDWRKCTEWLQRFNFFPRDPPSEPGELVAMLKDGVVLCHLLNKLSPGCIRPNDYSQRPQGCQFLCQKNINKFLQTCESTFRISRSELFSLNDLSENFQKVLLTLSQLSRLSMVEDKWGKGFQVSSSSASHSDIYAVDEDDPIYVTHGEDLYADDIYQDIMFSARQTIRLRTGRRPSIMSDEISTAKSVREKCIDELVDTEKHYLEVLTTLKEHFFNPLKNMLPPEDHAAMFSCTEKLHRNHTDFFRELEAAKPADHALPSTLPDVFMKYKEKFIIYGEYCSNLPRAFATVEDVCRRNSSIELFIKNCEKEANQGKFKLIDLFTVPFQRVLKYHLLLKELIKNTDSSHPDYQTLHRALEATNDLALYVNEVKRDNESLKAILDIQNSINELQMPPNTTLKDYGHLLKDGALKVKSKARFIFLFEKVMLICSQKNDAYKYCDAYILDRFDLRDQDKKNFKLIEHGGGAAGAQLVFTADSEDMKKKWMEAINMANDNVSPRHAETKKHSFVLDTLPPSTICAVCRKLLRGVFFQGYRCTSTDMVVHKECMERADEVEPPTIVERNKNANRNNKVIAKVKAVYSYSAEDDNQLSLEAGMAFDLLEKTNRTWWLGRLRGAEGYFPANFVRVTRDMLANNYEAVSTQAMPEPTQYVNLDDFAPKSPTSTSSEAQTWFVGKMSKDEAIRTLESKPNGTYLVRIGARGYAISISYNGVKHLMINESKGTYSLDRKRCFTSIEDIVTHYRETSLESVFDVIDTKLAVPIGSPQPPPPTSPTRTSMATGAQDAASGKNGPIRASQVRVSATGTTIIKVCKAQFDYAANQVNQLTLREGDILYVTSTAGEGRGWWKGQLNGQTGYFPCAYVEEIIES